MFQTKHVLPGNLSFIFFPVFLISLSMLLVISNIYVTCHNIHLTKKSYVKDIICQEMTFLVGKQLQKQEQAVTAAINSVMLYGIT